MSRLLVEKMGLTIEKHLKPTSYLGSIRITMLLFHTVY